MISAVVFKCGPNDVYRMLPAAKDEFLLAFNEFTNSSIVDVLDA
jgi:hypothetical protein